MMNQEHLFYKKAVDGLLPDPESIRTKALKQAGRSRRRWVLPAVAGLVGLAVICAAVPPVRAAIVQWFTRNGSVQNYLAQPEEARPAAPELEAVIVQTKPGEAAAENSIEIAAIAPEWQVWADSLKPSAGDVLFDGKELMVSFDMGGGAGELLLGGNAISIDFGNPGYMILNGEKYNYSASTGYVGSEYDPYYPHISEDGRLSEEGQKLVEADDSVRFIATVDFSGPAASQWIAPEDWPEDLPEGSWEEHLAYIAQMQQYDPDYTPIEFKETPDELAGVQQAELHLPLIATDYSTPARTDKDGAYYDGVPIGMVMLRFSFDPAAGYAFPACYGIDQSAQFSGEGTYAWADWNSDPDYVTFVNKTVDMAGVKATVKRMECTATGAELYVSLTCPDGWDELDRQCFLGNLRPVVKADGEVLPPGGAQYGLGEAGEDAGMRIHIQLLPSEAAAVKTYEITWALERFSGYDDVPYVEGEPTRIKQDEVGGWQTDAAELTGCALRFSLK